MAFSYTGSALNSLVDGLTNNAAPVVTLFNDVKAVLDNGITGAAHLSASAAVADTQLASPNNVTYKQIVPSLVLSNYTGGVVTQMTSGNSYVARESDSTDVLQPSSAGAGAGAFYLNPADYTAGSKTNEYRLRVSLLVNGSAPTSTFTFGVYPVTATGGGGGPTLTLGAVTAGSTVAFAAPGASSLNQSNSGDFTAPAAGYLAVVCKVTVATSVIGSAIHARAILQHRQV